MPITHLRALSVPANMRATRLAGNPTGKGSVIGRDAPIAVLHQEADGSFTPAGMVTTAHTPEMKVTAPLPPDASESRSKPEFQVAVDQALPQSTGMAVPAPANPKAFVPSPAPAPAPPPESKKVRVRMSNRGMGRVTVSVRAVSISDTCVVLAYPKEADNIIEPPICGDDNPIKVEYEGNSFLCVFGGWTAELEGMFLVFMPRTEPEDAAKAT